MATFTNTAEGGTDGTTVTPSNSGGASGDAFAGVSFDGGGTMTFSTAEPYKGTLGYKLDCPTSGHANVSLGMNASAPNGRVRFYMRMTAYPSSTVQLIQSVDTTSSEICYTYVDGSGSLMVIDSTGSILYSFANPMSLNTWYRVEMVIANGTTSSNGTLRTALYAGDSATAIETYAATNVNAGSNPFKTWNLFKNNSTPTWTGVYFDDIYADTGVSGSTFIGPSPSTVRNLDVGSTTASNLYVGTTAVTAAYAGVVKVWG